LDHEAAETCEAEAEPLGLPLVWVLKPELPAMPDEALDLVAGTDDEVQTGETSGLVLVSVPG